MSRPNWRLVFACASLLTVMAILSAQEPTRPPADTPQTGVGAGDKVVTFTLSGSLGERPDEKEGTGAQQPAGPRADTPDGVLSRLRNRIGATPIECGRHARQSLTPPDSYGDALTASVRCVLDSAAKRRPSWMFAELRGIDSWVATGLASDAKGAVQLFVYDSDPSGGSAADAYLGLKPCRTPSVIRDGGRASIECSGTAGGD